MHDIINLQDDATKGEVTRDVGPDWQYMGRPSQAMGGVAGSPLATPGTATTSQNAKRATLKRRYRPPRVPSVTRLQP